MTTRKSVCAALAITLAVLGLAASRSAAQAPQRPRTANDGLLSPEVAADRKVTFRTYAPKASEVTVGGDFLATSPPAKLTRDDKGVWSATVGPLTPDFYSYAFTVDGVKTLDPKNPTV